MNPAKVGIIQASLSSLPIKVLTLNDLSLKIEVKEDGLSTEENAEKKVRAYNEKVFFDTFTFRTILTSKRKGRVIPGAPLNALTIDPATGKYYSEMAWEEQPHGRWIFEFVKRHIEEL